MIRRRVQYSIHCDGCDIIYDDSTEAATVDKTASQVVALAIADGWTKKGNAPGVMHNCPRHYCPTCSFSK